MMRTISDEYQNHARECLRWAAEADNDEHREALLEMAKVWTQLALHQPAPSVAGGTRINGKGLGNQS